MPSELTPRLREALLRALIEKLARQIIAVELGERAGKLGPRVVRARCRHIEKERQRLAKMARQMGYQID